MAYTLEVDFYNSFWLKKVVKDGDTTPSWPGLPWDPYGDHSFSWNSTNPSPVYGPGFWYLEENKIKGGFNNTTAHVGVRAYVVDKNSDFNRKTSSLIYSGVFNTRTDYNATNVFSISDGIVRDADPVNGSIQKLYTEDTNLLMFQENKVSRVLINKSTIYSGEQGSTETVGTPPVLGQIVPFLGEYGISKNPESFAIFGYRKYFADKNRAAILRLSRDGITEISSYGMRDYFRDYLATISTGWKVITSTLQLGATYNASLTTVAVTSGICSLITVGANLSVVGPNPGTAVITKVVPAGGTSYNITFTPAITFTTGDIYIELETYYKDKIVGGFDIHNQNYVVSLQTNPRYKSTARDYATTSFDEHINGWVSFYSYKPLFVDSLKNKYYSFVDSSIYEHYSINPNNRSVFYGDTNNRSAAITFIFNPQPSLAKNFNTVSYEGSNGWKVESYGSDLEGFDVEWVAGVPTTVWEENQDVTNSVLSYVEGAYDGAGNTGAAADPLNPPLLRAGFDRKENRYVANLVSNSAARPGEVIWGDAMSGIKGYFATVNLTTDGVTDLGGMKELYAVSSNYVPSSY